jgi:hypothetical protein
MACAAVRWFVNSPAHHAGRIGVRLKRFYGGRLIPNKTLFRKRARLGVMRLATLAILARDDSKIGF